MKSEMLMSGHETAFPLTAAEGSDPLLTLSEASPLRHMQQEFQRAILARKNHCDLFAPGLGHLEERLSAYVEGYRTRLIDALAANYPILHAVLGDDDFEALARAYIDAHPSQQASIRWFGHRLEEFVIQHEDYLPHPALVDLIRVEWAIGEAFDGPDETPVTFAQLQAIPPERWPDLVFPLHPTVRLLSLQWHVAPALKALKEDRNAECPPPQALTHHLLVWRRGLAPAEWGPAWRSLGEMEAEALLAVAAGGDFTQVCSRVENYLAEKPGDAPAPSDAPPALVAGLLRGWVEEGLLLAP